MSRAPSEIFDDLVLDAVDELEHYWGDEVAALQFAVEEVPPAGPSSFDPTVLADRGVPLGRVDRTKTGAGLIIVYRRPLEARAGDPLDRGELVFSVVAELVADALGKDVDELDRPS